MLGCKSEQRLIAADLDVNEFAEGTQSARLTVNVEDGSPIFSSCSSYMPGATSLLVHFSAKSDVNGAVLEAKTVCKLLRTRCWRYGSLVDRGGQNSPSLLILRKKSMVFALPSLPFNPMVSFGLTMCGLKRCRQCLSCAMEILNLPWMRGRYPFEDAEATVAATPANLTGWFVHTRK